MKHYVVISADCHAGPNSPVYKDFLDPRYHDDFEVELTERQALIDERREAAGMSPFMGDVEVGIAEIERAQAEGWGGGIIIPPQWGDHESYTSYRYDPVWAVAQDLDLPVHCHSGPGAHQDYGEVPGWMSVYGYETI